MIRKNIKLLLSKATRNNYKTLNVIEINEANLLSNFNYFKNKHRSLSVIPVLKANAYGHGITNVATILNKADCDFLAVDGYFEAAKIRDITRHKILVLGFINPINFKLLDTKKCSFVIQDIASLEALSKLSGQVNVHIELNTGMNRLGLSTNELESYLKDLKNLKHLNLEGVMTHLADADNENDDEFTNKQAVLYDNMAEIILSHGFKPKYFHIAQTAGSTKVKSKFANSQRIGIGIYGINPLHHDDPHFKELENLKPVLELKSTIIKVINLKPGDKVSYNGIFTASQEMRVGVLPLGYYEGVQRELSNKGFVTYNNEVLPMVGRVCMNHVMIDLKQTELNVGSTVVVISNNPKLLNSIKQISQSNNLFNYALLTGLSSSTRRVIV